MAAHSAPLPLPHHHHMVGKEGWPMRGRDLIMWPEGQWEASKKIAWKKGHTYTQTHRRTSLLYERIGQGPILWKSLQTINRPTDRPTTRLLELLRAAKTKGFGEHQEKWRRVRGGRKKWDQEGEKDYNKKRFRKGFVRRWRISCLRCRWLHLIFCILLEPL